MKKRLAALPKDNAWVCRVCVARLSKPHDRGAMQSVRARSSHDAGVPAVGIPDVGKPDAILIKKIINHSIHFRYLLLIRYLIQDVPQKTDEQDRRGGEMDGFSSRPNCKTEGGRKMLLGRNQNKDLAGGETGKNGGFCRRSVTILLQFLICFFPAVIVQYDIIRSQSGSGGNK